MSSPRRLALITGASSGIGRALAIELARQGYDVFATGRNETQLTEVVSHCSKHFGIQARSFAIDLGTVDGAQKLIAALGADVSQIDVLVNNAGFGVHGTFERTTLARELEMVRVQIDAMLILTKTILPGMRSRSAGRILNVASVYSFIPVPFQSVYAACKSFMLSLSESLSYELADSGVTVSCLCPGTTITAFRSREGISEKLSGMTAESVAQIGLDGMFRGRRVIVPGWKNKILVFLASNFPRALTLPVLSRVNRYRGVGGH